MTRPAGLLEIGQIRRAHGVRGQVAVELVTDRLERVEPGARWWARDGWVTVVSSSRHQDRWLVTLRELGDRSAAQRYTNTPIYAEPVDDGAGSGAGVGRLWVHHLIGDEVVEVSGRERGRCVSVVANPASDLLELDDGTLVPVVFVVSQDGGRIIIDPPLGLFDDDDDDDDDDEPRTVAEPAASTESVDGS